MVTTGFVFYYWYIRRSLDLVVSKLAKTLVLYSGIYGTNHQEEQIQVHMVNEWHIQSFIFYLVTQFTVI